MSATLLPALRSNNSSQTIEFDLLPSLVLLIFFPAPSPFLDLSRWPPGDISPTICFHKHTFVDHSFAHVSICSLCTAIPEMKHCSLTPSLQPAYFLCSSSQEKQITDPWSFLLIYTNYSFNIFWELPSLWTDVIYRSLKDIQNKIYGFVSWKIIWWWAE